jgi:ankyrin repeat protein
MSLASAGMCFARSCVEQALASGRLSLTHLQGFLTETELEDSSGRTLLVHTVELGSVADVALALDAGVDVRYQKEDDNYDAGYRVFPSALHAACKRGDVAIVALLVKRNAPLDAITGLDEDDPLCDGRPDEGDICIEGMTPLMNAMASNHLEVVRCSWMLAQTRRKVRCGAASARTGTRRSARSTPSR